MNKFVIGKLLLEKITLSKNQITRNNTAVKR